MRIFVPILLLCAIFAGCRRAPDRFYASAESGTKIIQIDVQGDHQAVAKLIGPTGTVGCVSMALSPSGTLYSMCGPGVMMAGPQQLSIIDLQTGRANPVGATVSGLTIMGMKFGPDGTLYAVGDSNAQSPAFNSLYIVDTKTGTLNRIGTTGAPAFFMDFTFDPKGTLYGATSTELYTIDPKTGRAVKVADFAGGGPIMGLAFNRDGTKLYASDFKTPVSDLYLADIKSGRLTPVAPTGFASSHNLVLADR